MIQVQELSVHKINDQDAADRVNSRPQSSINITVLIIFRWNYQLTFHKKGVTLEHVLLTSKGDYTKIKASESLQFYKTV